MLPILIENSPFLGVSESGGTEALEILDNYSKGNAMIN